MIHFSGISKQYGPQVLFRDASFQILPGSRSGLVGPNGAGKTSIFRLIMGEEEFDAGEITKARNCVCGYFSQDVGNLSGRSALQEVIAASEAVVQLGRQIQELEAAMCRPMAEEEMADLLERYGNIQAEFEHRG
ncbi:MAG: ATP-binding cassette domain-containing protein, partial [Syntrophales bacterium]